jgi:multimeric flavodoxin WrbA
VLLNQGRQVESVRLADARIGGCTACFVCQKVADAPGCPLKDDMPAVYDRVLAADAVVLATPVYCWGMAAQLKAPVDRFYAFCKFGHTKDGQFTCLVEGKRAALVVTGGGGPYDGAEVCVSGFRAMAEFMRMDNRGEFVAAPVTDAAAICADAALLARAAEFARKIVE